MMHIQAVLLFVTDRGAAGAARQAGGSISRVAPKELIPAADRQLGLEGELIAHMQGREAEYQDAPRMDDSGWEEFLNGLVPGRRWQRFHGNTPSATYSVVVVLGEARESEPDRPSLREFTLLCPWGSARLMAAAHSASLRLHDKTPEEHLRKASAGVIESLRNWFSHLPVFEIECTSDAEVGRATYSVKTFCTPSDEQQIRELLSDFHAHIYHFHAINLRWRGERLSREQLIEKAAEAVRQTRERLSIDGQFVQFDEYNGKEYTVISVDEPEQAIKLGLFGRFGHGVEYLREHFGPSAQGLAALGEKRLFTGRPSELGAPKEPSETPPCHHCGKPFPQDQAICPACQNEPPNCPRCATYIRQGTVCWDCWVSSKIDDDSYRTCRNLFLVGSPLAVLLFIYSLVRQAFLHSPNTVVSAYGRAQDARTALILFGVSLLSLFVGIYGYSFSRSPTGGWKAVFGRDFRSDDERVLELIVLQHALLMLVVPFCLGFFCLPSVLAWCSLTIGVASGVAGVLLAISRPR